MGEKSLIPSDSSNFEVAASKEPDARGSFLYGLLRSRTSFGSLDASQPTADARKKSRRKTVATCGQETVSSSLRKPSDVRNEQNSLKVNVDASNIKTKDFISNLLANPVPFNVAKEQSSQKRLLSEEEKETDLRLLNFMAKDTEAPKAGSNDAENKIDVCFPSTSQGFEIQTVSPAKPSTKTSSKELTCPVISDQSSKSSSGIEYDNFKQDWKRRFKSKRVSWVGQTGYVGKEKHLDDRRVSWVGPLDANIEQRKSSVQTTGSRRSTLSSSSWFKAIVDESSSEGSSSDDENTQKEEEQANYEIRSGFGIIWPDEFEAQFKRFSVFNDPDKDGKTISHANCDLWLEQAGILDHDSITFIDTGMCMVGTTAQADSQLTFQEFVMFVKALARRKKFGSLDLVNRLSYCGKPRIKEIITPSVEVRGYGRERRRTSITERLGSLFAIRRKNPK